MQRKKFTEEQILNYTAQITLSLLALHSKHILHRDVKTQNILIKEGVLKLGDFGISKALADDDELATTACGTLYFMSPEVCIKEPYGPKADLWAMGVILYELITLKKPFEGPNTRILFDKIVNQPLDPLPDDTSADVQLVVKALLNKNIDRRPTIVEVAKIPCINKKIEEFINEYNCKEEVLSFFEVETENQN